MAEQRLQGPVGGGIQIAQSGKDRCPPADESHRPVKGTGGQVRCPAFERLLDGGCGEPELAGGPAHRSIEYPGRRAGLRDQHAGRDPVKLRQEVLAQHGERGIADRVVHVLEHEGPADGQVAPQVMG
jgi:hypothetical protein